MKEPNFFIIGAPKCGTTAIARYLSEHPAVFITNPKEPHHYNTDLNHGAYKDKSAYQKLFEDADNQCKAIGEASVWYLYSNDAIRNILKEIPDAKFVVMLRNPVEMAYSLHEQMVFSGGENVLDFHSAWNLQPKRKEGKNIPLLCEEKKLLLYKEVCFLGKQLERAMQLIPNENLHVILFDDFKEEPLNVWLALQSFLGVESDGRKLFPVVNSAKERRSHLVKRLNDLYRRILLKIGVKPLGIGFFTALDQRNKTERDRTPLPEHFNKELINVFSEEVNILEKLLNRDLSKWKR